MRQRSMGRIKPCIPGLYAGRRWVFDQITQRYQGVKKGWGVWIRKINKCALEMKFTGHDLADLINSHYRDLANWQHSANVALQEGLVKVCKTKK